MTTKQLTIIMYHYVRPIKNSQYPKIKGLEINRFKRQIDYFSSRYNFITAEQLIANSLGEKELPKNPCYLTFDDGFRDHFRYVVPELLKRNIQGSFFPPSRAIENQELLDVHAIHFIVASLKNINKLFIDLNNACLDIGLTKLDLGSLYRTYAKPYRYANGSYDDAKTVYVKRMLQFALPEKTRSKIVSHLFKKYVKKNKRQFASELYMSISDIKNLIKNGMYVGSHGSRHIWLSKEKKVEQAKDIKLSLDFLKKVGARTKNWIMCYPYGSYNNDTLKILRKNKCSIGLTSKAGMANLSESKILELNRYDTNQFPQ
jgi:peptidoglycan/xylan/chitin deacetylase (PgdA/CDA1 family)